MWLALAKRPRCQGKGGNLRGLLLHAVLAVDAGSGALLGLLDADAWNRSTGKVAPRRGRQTAEKESQRWLDGTRTAAEDSVVPLARLA